MALPTDTLRALVEKSLETETDEITCDECDLEVMRFVEMELSGLDAAEALPIVEAHLSGCPCCEEEYLALMDVLRAAERANLPWWKRWRARGR